MAMAGLVAGRRLGGLKNQLLVVLSLDDLIEVAQHGINVDRHHHKIAAQLAMDVQDALVFVDFQGILGSLGVVVEGFGDGGELPGKRELYRDIIHLAIWIREIDGVDATGVLEHVLLRSDEKARGQERAAPRRREPALHLEIEFGDQRVIGTVPRGLIGQLNVNPHGHELADFIFEILFSRGIVFIAFIDAAGGCGKAGVGNFQFAFQRSVFGKLQIRGALNLGGVAHENRGLEPSAAVLIEFQPNHSGFRPRKHSKRGEFGAGIEKKVFAVKLGEDDVGVEFAIVHALLLEEIFIAGGNETGMRFDARRAREGHKKPGNLVAGAVAGFPEFFDVARELDFFALFLLLRLFFLIRKIAELLYTRVDLLELHFRRVAGRNDLRGGLFHGFALVDEVFGPGVALFAEGCPELIDVALGERVVVDEIDAKLQFIFRRHVVFLLEGGDIVGGHLDDAAGILLGRLGILGQSGRPDPLHDPAIAVIGFEAELGVPGEELLAENPAGIEDVVVRVVVGVVAFNDAANGNVGHGKGLGEELQRFRFNDGIFKNLAVEFDNGAVRMNGARADAINGVLAFDKGDFHVAVFAAFFGQNLDSNVVVLGSADTTVVAVDLPVKIESRGHGGERFAGHLQFIGSYGPPVVATGGGSELQG